jgi:hypothetical protein
MTASVASTANCNITIVTIAVLYGYPLVVVLITISVLLKQMVTLSWLSMLTAHSCVSEQQQRLMLLD